MVLIWHSNFLMSSTPVFSQSAFQVQGKADRERKWCWRRVSAKELLLFPRLPWQLNLSFNILSACPAKAKPYFFREVSLKVYFIRRFCYFKVETKYIGTVMKPTLKIIIYFLQNMGKNICILTKEPTFFFKIKFRLLQRQQLGNKLLKIWLHHNLQFTSAYTEKWPLLEVIYLIFKI